MEIWTFKFETFKKFKKAATKNAPKQKKNTKTKKNEQANKVKNSIDQENQDAQKDNSIFVKFLTGYINKLNGLTKDKIIKFDKE